MYYPYMQMPRHHRRIMTVIGIGNVSIATDIVRIQLEVITENKQLQRAQQENASVMNGVIESLVALGIDRSNVQTVSYNITPQYDYIEGEQRFRGYQVTNAITVQTTNIQQIGAIIDTAVQNGVNRVSNIQFTVADEQKYYEQALSLALENAVAKAETIARTMQLQLEPQPIRIVEEISGQPVAYRALASEVSTPIEQGQVSIHAKVKVQFEY